MSSNGTREDVVEHERQALGRLERLEHDEQGGADRVGGERLALRVRGGVVGERDDRVGQPARLERGLAAALAGVEHRQAHAGGDRRQPRAHVLYVARVRALEADPRLLEGVVGLGARAQDPRRHGEQVRSVSLEFVHLSHPRDPGGRGPDRRQPTDVTGAWAVRTRTTRKPRECGAFVVRQVRALAARGLRLQVALDDVELGDDPTVLVNEFAGLNAFGIGSAFASMPLNLTRAAVYAAWLASTEWIDRAAFTIARLLMYGPAPAYAAVPTGSMAAAVLMNVTWSARSLPTVSRLTVGGLTAARPRTFLSAATCAASCAASLVAAAAMSASG